MLRLLIEEEFRAYSGKRGEVREGGALSRCKYTKKAGDSVLTSREKRGRFIVVKKGCSGEQGEWCWEEGESENMKSFRRLVWMHFTKYRKEYCKTWKCRWD